MTSSVRINIATPSIATPNTATPVMPQMIEVPCLSTVLATNTIIYRLCTPTNGQALLVKRSCNVSTK